LTESSPSIFAVVLAAGAASRFGSSKQLATWGGEPLVHRASRLARETCGDRTLLVVGHAAAEVAAAAGGECRFIAYNERFRDGLSSSLALAVRVLGKTSDAILLLLADQPRVTPEHLRMMVEEWNGNETQIVASAYSDTLGAPALLPAGTFAKILRLSGDVGARALFDDPDFDVTAVRFDAAAADIDTPADLAALGRPDQAME